MNEAKPRQRKLTKTEISQSGHLSGWNRKQIYNPLGTSYASGKENTSEFAAIAAEKRRVAILRYCDNVGITIHKFAVISNVGLKVLRAILNGSDGEFFTGSIQKIEAIIYPTKKGKK